MKENIVNEHYSHSLPERTIPTTAEARARRAALARATSGRRRFVDPATCERDYTAEEQEFMNAIQVYKRASGRMFPTWSEVLEVLKNLGYRKGFDNGTCR